MPRIVLYGCTALLLSSVSTLALAATTQPAASGKSSVHTITKNVSVGHANDLEVLQVLVKQQKQAIAEQTQKIQQQDQKITAIQGRLEHYVTAQQKLNNNELGGLRGTGAPAAAGAKNDAVGVERKPKPKDKPPEIPAIVDEGGVLLRKGTLVVEPSLEYSRSSALQVAIEGFTIIPALSIGSFTITQVDRDTLTAALTGRYGITNRLEVEARVPYVYRNDSTLTRAIGGVSTSDTLYEADGNNLGDIEAAVHYQINDGKNGLPFFISNLRFKSRTGEDPFEVSLDPGTGLQKELPTGSGFYGLQPSVTAIFPSDPVVFYSNLGYMVNFERDLGGSYGKINPGDSVSAGLGMGFSINERSSFSLGYNHDIVFKTTQNGAGISNAQVLQVGMLNVGYAYSVSNRVNVNFNVGAGLTDDAPDVQLLMRVPVAFDLLK